MVEGFKVIIGITFAILLVLMVIYILSIGKRQRQFKQEIENYGLDNPDEVVSVEEVNTLFKRFSKVYVMPYRNLILLMIIEILLSILFVIIR